MKYQKTINKLITKGIITNEDADLYAYGLEIAVMYLISLTISALISIFLHGTAIYLIFLATFLPLRASAGGFHFDNSFICQFFSQILIILPQLIIPKMIQTNIYIPSICFFIIFISDMLILFKQGAKASKNRYSDENIVEKFTKKSIYILSVYLIVFILLIYLKWQLAAYTLLYVILLEGILLLIPEKQ